MEGPVIIVIIRMRDLGWGGTGGDADEWLEFRIYSGDRVHRISDGLDMGYDRMIPSF